jgi:hypothetical protein
VQLISSDLNKIWPPTINDRTFARLGCEKELVRMNADQWSVSQAFNAEYAGLVLRWFDKVGDRVAEALA